jgi:hypothetical protein
VFLGAEGDESGNVPSYMMPADEHGAGQASVTLRAEPDMRSDRSKLQSGVIEALKEADLIEYGKTLCHRAISAQ